MINELSIYLSMEIWGCFFCLIYAGYVYFGKELDEPDERDTPKEERPVHAPMVA